jgi:4-amino-4-deoxy-L-arabinose transferase-like glycosyltransferase
MFFTLPKNNTDRWFLALYIAATGAYLLGMLLDITGMDATQYASMSLELMQDNSWLEIMHRGEDYLDKPPLHFWLSAMSFKIFGVSNFAYKLPSFLVTLLGVYSIVKLGNLLYGKPIGRIAGLMYYTTQAMFLINHDVRTDTILVGFIAFASYHLLKWCMHGGHIHWIAGFAGAGVAMLAKGPLGLMVPLLAVGGYILISRNWKKLLRLEWIGGMLIVAAVISPVLYGLWNQWDMHPEKKLYGMDGLSGVRFYLWDQSFGRLTGTNPFINQLKPNQGNDPSFFLHTSLWSLLPWSIACFAAWILSIKKLIHSEIFKHITNRRHHCGRNNAAYDCPHHVGVQTSSLHLRYFSVFYRCGCPMASCKCHNKRISIRYKVFCNCS